jgi:hydroxyversicolorone monooxygenase
MSSCPACHPYLYNIDPHAGVWFVQIADNYGHNHEYTPDQREQFRQDPNSLVAHAKSVEDKVNGFFFMMYKNAPGQLEAKKIWSERMAEHIKDKRLLEGLTPTWGVGCRRITPGDPYMQYVVTQTNERAGRQRSPN